MEFNLVDLVISIRADKNTNPSEILLLLGSELSMECRSQVCCLASHNCECCSVRPSCAWYIVFGQELSPDPEALRCHQKPPLPFVLSISIPEVTTEDQRIIECRLVVIGHAIHYLDMLLDAVTSILNGGINKGRYEILQLASRDYQGSLQPLGKKTQMTLAKNLVVLSVNGILESHPWDSDRIGIRLLSPLKLLSSGRQVRKFDFRLFARSLLRRISSLAYYYGESEFVCDFKALSRQVETIICTDDHYCLTTSSNRKMSGISGYGKFCGDFSCLMPFLVLGTYVNAGKSAAFGMGRFELTSN